MQLLCFQKTICLIAFIGIFSTSAFSQYRINGQVLDDAGEPLIGANVYAPKLLTGDQTNESGFFSILVPAFPVELVVSFIGLKSDTLFLSQKQDSILRIQLERAVLGELIVTSSVADKTSNATHPGIVSIPLGQLKVIPAIGGEVDVIKAFSFTPGVTNGSEGQSGLFVRGGSPDQNLILLDDAPVYNPNHLFGFVSVFNADALKKVELYKGGIPARYGGRLSSVLDVRLKEGARDTTKGMVGIGIISSRFLLEGPISKKTSYLISARSSYLGLITLPMRLALEAGNTDQYINYWMYDANAKLNCQLTDRDYLSLSLYSGNDHLKSIFDDQVNRSNLNLGWGNITSTLRWQRALSSGAYLKNMLIFSDFKYGIETENKSKAQEDPQFSGFGNYSGLRNYTFSTELEKPVNRSFQYRVGLKGTQHEFNPRRIESVFQSPDTAYSLQTKQSVEARELTGFVEFDWRPLDWFGVESGIRYNYFLVNSKAYPSLEPRASLVIRSTKQIALKAGYFQTTQNLHLLSNLSGGFQNDIWVPATDLIAPSTAKQWSFGVTYIPSDSWEVSAEYYHKKMNNLIDYKESVFEQLFSTESKWEDLIEQGGTGTSKGFEVGVQKTKGSFTCLAAYTRSRTNRQFQSINLGRPYPFIYDYPNNFSFTGNMQFQKGRSLSVSWVYHTGQPFSLPSYSVSSENIFLPRNSSGGRLFIYEELNGTRLPDYHRADVAFMKSSKNRWGGTKTWTFGVYNAYYRKNVLYVRPFNKSTFDPSDGSIKYTPTIKAESFLPIIPSISYSTTF